MVEIYIFDYRFHKVEKFCVKVNYCLVGWVGHLCVRLISLIFVIHFLSCIDKSGANILTIVNLILDFKNIDLDLEFKMYFIVTFRRDMLKVPVHDPDRLNNQLDFIKSSL